MDDPSFNPDRGQFLLARRALLKMRLEAHIKQATTLLQIIARKTDPPLEADIQEAVVNLVREHSAICADLRRAIQEIENELGTGAGDGGAEPGG